ncbi:MAG: sensor domain-containing diguanylate cyclase [Sphaerochaeta sp.]|nr:sensor domain-containing diguanylate cyclase [Sphaerochaeta sp.]
MIRITKRVFSDLAIWMMGFGILVGLVFPFFMLLLGIEPSIVMTWWFFAVCMLAGLCVGAVNIMLSHRIVGDRLNLLAKHMKDIENHLKSITGSAQSMDCTPANCHIPVDSEDAIGASSLAFNNLVDTLAKSIQIEMDIRAYTQLLSTHLETDHLCRNALTSLNMMIGCPSGAILVEDGGELRVYHTVGLTKSSSLSTNPLILDSMQTLKRNVINIPEDVMLEGVMTSFRPREIIVEPIVYKHQSLGAVVLASDQTFSPEVLDHLDLFGTSLALALHNAITHDQVQKLAAIDPLTNVYNRRFGLSRLHEEFVRAVKQNMALAVLMIDIDHFKQVNDVYGHTVGDRVLRTIAGTTRTQMREGDILVRLGGDEFMVVLLGASKADALEVGEAIRRQIDEKHIKYGEQSIHVTLSLGGASFPELDVEYEKDLLEAADQALYRVKESGRNKMAF